jgi:ABC-type glycerol-3-phosphate transport system permease component
VRAWSKAQFNRYLLNSVIYAVCSTSISVIVSALAGYVLARYKFPGSRFLQLLILAMLFLPTATSILPVFDLMQKLGILNTPFAVILALSGGVGFSAILFQGYFRNIPQDLYDAAMVDGASFLQQFRLVLPLARPIIATSVILGFNSAWQDYFTPLVFTLGRPELRTLSVGLRAFTGQYSVDISGFAAATTISMVPIIIVFIIFQRQFVNGLAGAVKG